MAADTNAQIVLLTFPGNAVAGVELGAKLGVPSQRLELHAFPDGETLVRLPNELTGRCVLLLCSLDHLDGKLLPLLLTADAAREQGARRVGLVAPYLGYMRQDSRFHSGEAVSARTVAAVLERHVDFLITVEPHLHRIHSLAELYHIPAHAVSAMPAIVDWMRREVRQPLLIGPDQESSHWVAAIAAELEAPYLILDKVRHGDRAVEILMPELAGWTGHTPVLLDDILATAQTMITAVRQLKQHGLPDPVCVAVHPILVGDALSGLLAAGAARVVSCNTIAQPSNAIDVMPLIAEAVKPFCHK
ncbi:ribose-phosphate diphosphokinase [Crenobacter sp. SG2303]|uniref:ribose-phosphate diphosphokinase n=1 Tax=Crenobacter oryzisoli TaxID=3056844 RepID=A0ABT7XIA2_9NEIS|nr:ribose-phosphate diphosphokinase [Crenobacter sp. SG2303]MDN0073515.1 ribose-phosphate diphosphokinase [Crenobacter sp. SG2303]